MVDQDRLQQIKVLAFNLYLTKQREVSVFECIRAVSRECRVHINRKIARQMARDLVKNLKDIDNLRDSSKKKPISKETL